MQAGSPGTPLNTRAGWGYLMLTNFLPAGGNGTFTLYAYADDRDGHTTLLGIEDDHAPTPRRSRRSARSTRRAREK